MAAEENNSGWSLQNGRSHQCNCIGCCKRCGTCRTAPWHTAEYCRMKVRHAAELAELVRRQTADGVTPGLEYGTY